MPNIPHKSSVCWGLVSDWRVWPGQNKRWPERARERARKCACNEQAKSRSRIGGKSVHWQLRTGAINSGDSDSDSDSDSNSDSDSRARRESRVSRLLLILRLKFQLLIYLSAVAAAAADGSADRSARRLTTDQRPATKFIKLWAKMQRRTVVSKTLHASPSSSSSPL